MLQEAGKACPGMELYLGCEVCYELDVSEKLANGSVLTINDSRYVLLEFQDNAFRSRLLEGTLELLNFGYIPILAHVERYEAFYQNKTLARELVELGALLQVNADSVIGKRGFGTKCFCHRLMRSHLVHFIGSDAHNAEKRPPELKLCYEKLKRKYGQSYAELLLCKNARAVLSGEDNIEC
jgi:protein-tyrosine phosphatase